MAESKLVSELMSIIRDRTDQADSDFITDAELIRYIDMSWGELYNLIVEANSSYYLSSEVVNIVAGTDLYNLPTDFYKLQGIDANRGGNEIITLTPMTFNDRNKVREGRDIYVYDWRYILRGDQVQLLPIPSGSTFTIWYTPIPATLTSSSDTINTVNHGWRWIVADVCSMVAKKAEENASEFIQEKAIFESKINKTLAVRDEGFAHRVIDINTINDWEF